MFTTLLMSINTSVDLYEILFFGVTFLALVLFISGLALYLSAKSKNKKKPGSVPKSTMTARLVFLILSLIISVPILLLALGNMLLVFAVIAFM